MREDVMRRVILGLWLAFICWNLTAAQKPPVRAAEREKIVQTISSCIGWAKDKNLELLFGVIANDEDYISVTPGTRIVKRFEDVKQSVPFWMSPDFKYIRHELKDLEIVFPITSKATPRRRSPWPSWVSSSPRWPAIYRNGKEFERI